MNSWTFFYCTVKTLAVKAVANLINYKQFPKVFSPIFTAFNRVVYGFTLPMAKYMTSCLFSKVSTLSLQYCNYYWMYFYNKLTIASIANLCHEWFNFSAILSIIYTCKHKLLNEDNIAPCANNRWLLSACQHIIIDIRGRVHVALVHGHAFIVNRWFSVL